MTVLVEHFDLDMGAARQLALFGPRYNIAPTQDILAVREIGGRREPAMLRWGLIPSWAKEMTAGPPMINARAETLAEKPAFRTAYRCRRCIIPADGFYEWKKSTNGAKGSKQPYYIHRPGGEPFGFAGLWEAWRGRAAAASDESDAGIESCTIVTTTANRMLSELHDRMPVILAPADYELWLDPTVDDPDKLQHLLGPTDDDELLAEPVSTHVNRVANDDARCIAVERSLFE
jgi:putative SOS response-associated peptidase YedK